MDIPVTAAVSLERETVRRLSRRSNYRGLRQLGLHGGLLGATGFLIWLTRGHAWLAGALMLHGISLSFLFCALHESVHRTAFASRWLNDLVAWICGLLLILPPEYFRAFHFAHHRFTQDPERDPELAVAPPATRLAYLWRVSGLPYWGDRLGVTLAHALTGRVPETFVPPEKAASVVSEARIFWACYSSVLIASLYWQRADALLYWVLPAVLGQPFLRLFLLAEHWDCAIESGGLEGTRTTHTNAIVLALAWRMPYHAEHHAFPSIPFHALPGLHELLREHLRVTSPGYLALHRELFRRLKGSSPRQRMTG